MRWSHLGPAAVAFLAIGFFLGTANAEVCSGGDACCTSRPEKCGVNEGDCDNDAECAGNLVCGHNNCGGSPGFDDTDDCCEIDPKFTTTTTTTPTTTTTRPKPNPFKEEYCTGVEKAYQIMSTTAEALGCSFDDIGGRATSSASCSDISCLIDIMKLPSCSKTPADCKTLASILKSMTLAGVKFCGWKDTEKDDPFGEGTRFIQGYTCYDNIWDLKQHCKCAPGERVFEFSSKFSAGHRDRVWSLRCSKIEPEFIVENDLDWIVKTDYNGWGEPVNWNGIADNAFMVGMQSYHANIYEDRKFAILWTKSKYWDLVDCIKKPLELNDFMEEINYRLHGNQVIAAIYSWYQGDVWADGEFDGYGDRKWYITVCRLEKKCTQMVSMEYDYDGATEVVEKAKFAGRNWFNNLAGEAENSVTTTSSVHSSEKFIDSYSFEYSKGHQTTASLEVMFGMDWGIEAGIPLLISGNANRKFEITGGFSKTWDTSRTWTRSNSKEATKEDKQEISFTSNCPPGCFCQLDVQVDMARASIPYTLTSRTKGSTNEADYCVEYGIMKGVKTWNARGRSNDTCT